MRDQNFDYCVKHYDPKISQKPKKQKLKKTQTKTKNQKQQQQKTPLRNK